MGILVDLCDTYHEEIPTSYGSSAPVYYYDAEPEEREDRFEMNDDLCVMDGEHFFIRGSIEIPIIGTDEHFIWGVWVSLSEANFDKVNEFWDKQELLEPMFGWLSTDLPYELETVSLKRWFIRERMAFVLILNWNRQTIL